MVATPAVPDAERYTFLVRVPPALELDDDRLFELCQANRELRIERTADGRLSIVPPTGGDAGAYNAALTTELGIWRKLKRTGVVFDSSAGFLLPNGAVRSADAAWVRRERWDAVPPEQRKKFVPLCPDFVVELLSPTDSLTQAQAKMEEYIVNGAQLGWLLDLEHRVAFVYRRGREVERLDDPAELSADPVLPGFVLALGAVLDAV